MRPDKRKPDQIRKVKIVRNFVKSSDGSVLISCGDTKVLCTAKIIRDLPEFIKKLDLKHGWLTAEYSMLPGSVSGERKFRERQKVDSRALEIQRIIGRALRSSVDLQKLYPNTIWVDCDVIQADGGTRTTAITGGCVAVYDAIKKFLKEGKFEQNPFRCFVAGVSVGVVDGKMVLDLCKDEDSRAEVDLNIVMTENLDIVDIQATAEITPFSEARLKKFINLAKEGIRQLILYQKKALRLK